MAAKDLMDSPYFVVSWGLEPHSAQKIFGGLAGDQWPELLIENDFFVLRQLVSAPFDDLGYALFQISLAMPIVPVSKSQQEKSYFNAIKQVGQIIKLNVTSVAVLPWTPTARVDALGDSFLLRVLEVCCSQYVRSYSPSNAHFQLPGAEFVVQTH